MADLKIQDLIFLVDTREQYPWDFSVLNNVEKKIRLRQKQTTLSSADYGVEGYEQFFVERKSREDLIGCLSTGRDRFTSELQRLRKLHLSNVETLRSTIADYDPDVHGFPPVSCVIVEHSWEACTRGDWHYSKITPNQVRGSIAGWEQWGIPFKFARNRDEAIYLCANYLFIGARRIQRIRDGITSKSKT